MKRIAFVIVTLCVTLQSFSQDQVYPAAKRVPVVDTFYNKYIVTDEYRWLEDIHNPEVVDWLEAQNRLSKSYCEKASNQNSTYTSIDQYSYTEFHHPQKDGNYYFYYAIYDLTAAPVLVYKSDIKDDGDILVNPTYISKTDKISLKGHAISKDSKYLAYLYSRNGSDWGELNVVSIKDKIQLKDHLENLKFTNIAWKDDGFFYSTYPRTDQFSEAIGQQVYYHKLGTDQKDDQLIFKKKNPRIHFSFQTTSDERFFLLTENDEDLNIYNIYCLDYQSAEPFLKPLLMKTKMGINFIDSHDGKLIATTTHKANNGAIVEIDPANPYKWRSIATEFTNALLLDVIPLKEKIIARYQYNHHPIVAVLNYDGETLYKLELPVASSVGGFSGNADDEEFLFTFNSYTIPPVVYKFNINTYERTLTEQTTVTFDIKNIEYKEVEYISKDSTKVPMYLVYKKGLKLDGNNPTLLSAYGGFGIVETPNYDPSTVYFIMKGGVMAYANIRGGGDYGEKWAQHGRGRYKQNSFDDFISAAEYLINSGYTNPSRLASTGGSNGGLVVAAAAIQRPDLFKAVIPVVGVFDMIRFERFTVGAFHKDEYGTVTDSLGFLNLRSYSPYFNIKEDVNYPAMLIVTSDNDDRVPPFHSYKFAARLQSRKSQINPVYLRIEKDAGHNGANTFMRRIRTEADIYGFIMKMIGGK